MKVLWIEDEIYCLSASVRWLEEVENHTVMEASTVSEALKLLESERFDFVLVDIMLPDDKDQAKAGNLNLEGGVEILNKWKQNGNSYETKWGTPFGVFTAVCAEETEKKALDILEQNKSRYLDKPFSLAQFKKLINKLIEQIEIGTSK